LGEVAQTILFLTVDATYEEISYPIAYRILTKCDAVLWIKGASNGADIETVKTKKMDLTIFYSLKDIPDIS